MNDTIITVTGNLTADPDLRFTPSGIAVANMTVASTPRRFDKARNEWRDGEANFLRVTVWREMAEHVAESLKRGDRVTVVGRLETQSWEDKETGAKRSAFQLQADEVAMSLRFGTAKFSKTERSKGQQAPSDDPWASTPPPAEPPFEDEPPF
jgi:single-strand DNA-binding protein